MNIEIRGLEELQRKLGNAVANKTLEPGMKRAVLFVQSYMAQYPPPPGGSAYRRTGTLGRRWTTKVTAGASGVQGKVGNNTVYGPFVQSSRFQASVHKGRWQTDEDAISGQNLTRITEFLQDEIDAALEG